MTIPVCITKFKNHTMSTNLVCEFTYGMDNMIYTLESRSALWISQSKNNFVKIKLVMNEEDDKDNTWRSKEGWCEKKERNLGFLIYLFKLKYKMGIKYLMGVVRRKKGMKEEMFSY